jgi:hypothetical protein
MIAVGSPYRSQRVLEIGRGGNINAGGVGRRGIRRNRRVGP